MKYTQKLPERVPVEETRKKMFQSVSTVSSIALSLYVVKDVNNCKYGGFLKKLKKSSKEDLSSDGICMRFRDS